MMDEVSGYSGYTSSAGDEEGGGILAYLPSILWHRRWWIVTPLVILTVAAILASFLLPASYRSSATLLVESPQLPSQLVGQQSQQQTSVIDERIAKVRQQVLSRPELIELIDNNGLYPEQRQTKPLSTVIDTMRKATSITPVNAEISNGSNGSNTIAFALTFEYPDAQKAQIVAQDFVERLMKFDASQTAEQAAGTVEFLQDQAGSLSGQMSSIEHQIEGIKAANGAALSSSGMVMMPSGGGGYQAQIASLQRDNAQLEAQINMQATAADRDPAVVAAEAQLAGARAQYSDSHPDVISAQARLAAARKFAAQNVQRSNMVATLRSQIASNNSAIASLSSVQGTEQARSSAIMSAQSRAPAVNEQVTQLQARLDGLRTNYQTIATNLLNARGTAKISEQQRGERLTVIDPPVVADQPSWPNRPLLIIGGIIAGVALGLLIALAFEVIARPIRGVKALEAVTGEAPMVIIPKISSKTGWRDRFRRRKRNRLSLADA